MNSSVVLNFQKKDLPALQKALSEMQSIPATNEYEHARFKDKENVVVVYSSGKTVIQGKKPEDAKNFLLEKMGLQQELVLGFDETGRGEKTGPMVVAGVLGDTNSLREVRDSKRTSDISQKYGVVTEKSLAIFSFSINAEFLDKLRKKGLNLNQIEAKIIDHATELFEDIGENSRIVVDGTGIKTKNKKTEFLVKGDDLEPVVGAASIAAKYLRENSGDKKKRETWKNNSA